MRPIRVLSLLVLSLVAVVAGPAMATADAGLTITGPTRIVVGSGSTIQYLVAGVTDPSVEVQWQLLGHEQPGGGPCYYAAGNGYSSANGGFRLSGFAKPGSNPSANSCAGAAQLVVDSFATTTPAQATSTVMIKRAAKWVGVNAAPEPIASGDVVAIRGTLVRANWEQGRYDGFSSSVAYLQFRSLTGAYKTYGVGNTASGLMVRHIHQRVSGCWRFVFAGSSTTNTATSPVDCVTVR